MDYVPAVLVLCACGSTTSSPAHPDRDELVAAPHYRSMFRRDASWTYHVSAQFPKDGTRVDKSFDITCRVAKVESTKQRLESTITCDAGEPLSHQLQISLAGTWIATPSGLANQLSPDIQVIAAVPEAATTASRTIAKVGEVWCSTITSAEEGPATCHLLCFDGDGIVAQMSTFAPGADADRESLTVSRAGSKVPSSCL